MPRSKLGGKVNAEQVTLSAVGSTRGRPGKRGRGKKVRSPERVTMSPLESIRFTGIGLSHTYDLLRRGVLPDIKVGRMFLIPRAALLRWLETCGSEPRPAA
jgi:excisionase family DNA binding protein